MQKLFWLLFITGLISACSDKPKKEWETASGGAYTSALSPNGQYALVGSVLHGGSLWRLKDGERLYNWNHTKGQHSKLVATAFSTDSKFALTAEKKRIVMWEVSTGKPVGFWPAEGGVLSMALSDNGRYAIIGQEDYTALYIDMASGSILSKLSHAGDINAVAISANGVIGVTGSEDGIMKVWMLPEGKVTFSYQLGDDVSAVALSRDASLTFGSLYYGKGKIWQTKTGKAITDIGFSRTTITSARFSQDNQSLLTGFTARRAILWNTQTGKQTQSWRAQAPLFWRPSGLVINDVAFGEKPGSYFSVFSNGLIYQW